MWMPFKYICPIRTSWENFSAQSNNFYVLPPSIVISFASNYMQTSSFHKSILKRSFLKGHGCHGAMRWNFKGALLKKFAVIYELFTYWMFITHWHLPFHPHEANEREFLGLKRISRFLIIFCKPSKRSFYPSTLRISRNEIVKF